MKPLHIVLLVTGAALAGGLAVRMAEPPPLPLSSAVHAAPPVSVPPRAPNRPAATPAPVPQTVPAPPRRVFAEPAPAIAPAPPPIYSEPPHVPQSVRRNPFGDARVPVMIAQATPPPVNPVPYAPPAAVRPEPKPEPVATPAEAEKPAPEPRHVAQPPHRVILQAGSPVTVRLLQTLSTERTPAGETFQAQLADPLVADGLVIAERGARVSGRVVNSIPGGLNGVSSIELRLLDFTAADGQRVAVSCDPWLKRSNPAGGGMLRTMGGGAVTIPGDTVIRFRLSSQVTVTERQL